MKIIESKCNFFVDALFSCRPDLTYFDNAIAPEKWNTLTRDYER